MDRPDDLAVAQAVLSRAQELVEQRDEQLAIMIANNLGKML